MEEDLRKQVEEAKEVLGNGGIVIFPTETAYGIAADATNPEAVEKVYELKERPREKGLTTIASSLSQVEEYAELSENEKEIVENFMPGPLTLVAEKKSHVPDGLNENFVFRISSSEIARTLAEDFPITATSANISGQETSYSVEDIDPGLRQRADYIIDVGELEHSPTSTIAEVNNSHLVIHRRGPITREQLKDVLK